MQVIRSMPRNISHLKLARWLVVAVFLALAAGAGALFPLVGAAKTTTALACGIGNTPTMDANGTPALQLPLPPNHNLSGNLPIGVFEPQYAVGQTITFSEDLSNVLNPPPLAGLQYQWSFGDGTQIVGLTVQHEYTKAGTYNVYSSIYSDGWQSFDSAQIVVVPQLLSDPPVAKLSASTDVIGPDGKITFSAGGSHARGWQQVDLSVELQRRQHRRHAGCYSRVSQSARQVDRWADGHRCSRSPQLRRSAHSNPELSTSYLAPASLLALLPSAAAIPLPSTLRDRLPRPHRVLRRVTRSSNTSGISVTAHHQSARQRPPSPTASTVPASLASLSRRLTKRERPEPHR